MALFGERVVISQRRVRAASWAFCAALMPSALGAQPATIYAWWGYVAPVPELSLSLDAGALVRDTQHPFAVSLGVEARLLLPAIDCWNCMLHHGVALGAYWLPADAGALFDAAYAFRIEVREWRGRRRKVLLAALAGASGLWGDAPSAGWRAGVGIDLRVSAAVVGLGVDLRQLFALDGTGSALTFGLTARIGFDIGLRAPVRR